MRRAVWEGPGRARLIQEEPLDRRRGRRGQDSHRKCYGRGRKESQNGWAEGEAAQEQGHSNGPH